MINWFTFSSTIDDNSIEK